MKKSFGIFVALLVTFSVFGQDKYFTKSGNLKFEASSPVEKIEGITKTGSSVIDTKTGNIEFAVLIKSIKFEQTLMEEHFNENYMESNKFNKATFKGKIANFDKINFAKDGTYKSTAEGDLTIHGVTKKVSSPVTFTVSGGKVKGETNFSIEIADYGIAIPSVVKDKIAKTAKILVMANYEKFVK